MSPRTVLALLALLLGAGPGAAAPLLAPPRRVLPMDPAAMARRQEDQAQAPDAFHHFTSARGAKAVPTAVNLLGDVATVGSLRNQGSNGNCTLWAYAGVAEVALLENHGYRDSLSIEYFDSLLDPADFANGSSLRAFCTYVNGPGLLVPWSNLNAAYVDGSPSIAFTNQSLIPTSAIQLAPAYTHAALQNVTIPTTGVGQDAGIANLKAVLAQNQAVCLSFYAEFLNGGGFFDWWANQPESAIWPVSNPPTGTPDGGHAVVIVGYDATDPLPANHYWIVLNSWGVSANRPNDLFRLPMALDYDATFTYNNKTYQYYTFETLTLTVDHPAATVPTLALTAPTAPPELGQAFPCSVSVTGYPPFTYQWFRNGAPLPGATSAGCTLPYLTAADGGATLDVVVTNTVGGAPVQTTSATATVGSMAGQQQVLLDPGFEDGGDQTPWTLVMDPAGLNDVGGYADDASLAHSGTWCAVLGAMESDGYLERPFTVPTGPGAVFLSWWSMVQNLSEWASPGGFLGVTILDGATGDVLRTAQVHSNWDPAMQLWHQDAFGLTDLGGRQVKVHAGGDMNASQWLLDDFAVTVDPGVTQGLPVVASFSPAAALAGASVALTGSGFTGTVLVLFNGSPATFVVNSDTQLTATVPACTSGILTVSTRVGTGFSASPFQNLLPLLYGCDPGAAARGSVVTLNGTSLTGATTVAFDGVAGSATVPATFTVLNDGQVTATIPALAITGSITLTTPFGTATVAVSVRPTGPVAIAISPRPTYALGGTILTFTATVTGDLDNRVNWNYTYSSQWGDGYNSQIDIYTFPLPGSLVLQAYWDADSTVTDTLTVPITWMDFQGSGTVDVLDMLALAQHYGTSSGQPSFEAAEDLNADGVVDDADVTLFMLSF